MQVLGKLAGDLGIARRGAVAVGGVACSAYLVRGGLRFGDVLRVGLRGKHGGYGAAHQCTYHPLSPRIVERRDFIRLFPQAGFLASAARPGDLPPPGPPELAFVGRSNVGKSSAINVLAGRKRLAFTSKTPGRTQTINFYSLGETARLADLPGYGYAKVPHALRRQWQELISAYLKSRSSLVGVVVIMDARHPLTPLDAQLLDWLGDARSLLLLSKADKLSRAEQAATLKKVRAAAGAGAMLFSSVTRQGVEECRGLLESWLEQAAEIKSPR